MKFILIAISLFTALTLKSEFTNGVFYVDNNTESVTVTQAGVRSTNKLEAGKTYQIGTALFELKLTNTTTFFFSGGPLIQPEIGAEFALLLFDQEVENLFTNPQKAKFGIHLLNLEFTKGDFSVVYPYQSNTNSRVNITTQYADYELTGGKYYFHLNNGLIVAYVIEGRMMVHGGKNQVDVVEKGNLTVAVPYLDKKSTNNIVASFDKSKSEEMEKKFTVPVLAAEKKLDDIGFFVIDGKVVGFLLK